jgi:hypothetical protein
MKDTSPTKKGEEDETSISLDETESKLKQGFVRKYSFPCKPGFQLLQSYHFHFDEVQLLAFNETYPL